MTMHPEATLGGALSRPAEDSLMSVNAVLSLVLLAGAILSLMTGAAPLSLAQLWSGALRQDRVAEIIVWDIRLPRLILSVTIGGFLGLSGAALQGLLRNPLAEAAIFGAPQTAALGAVVVLYFGVADALSFWLPVAAIFGATLSCFCLFGLVGRQSNGASFILAGVAIGSLAGSALALVLSLSPNPFAMTEILFWLMGSLEDRSFRHVALSLPFLIIASVCLMRCGRGYRALTLGEDAARSLGIDVSAVRALTIGGVAIGSGAGVAVAGTIGFIGLMAPHLVRPWCGGDPQRILVPSGLAGAAILTLADVIVRLVPSTSEIRVGVVTSLLGTPVFLYYVLSRRFTFGGVR